MSLSSLPGRLWRAARRPGPTKVRHIHASGRYDRSPRSLLAALRSYAARADILTLTEVNGEARAKVLGQVKSFRFYRGSGFPAADESAVMWRDDLYELVWSGCRRLADKTGSQRLSIAGEAVVLRHRKTGQTVLVIVAHTPAGVEGDWNRDPRTAKVTAHHTTTDVLTDWLSALSARFRPDGVIVSCDWNLNLHRDWVQRWLHDVFPLHGGLHATWTGRMPKGGTHGPRLIDWAMTNLRVEAAKILRRNPSSDHCAFLEILLLPIVRA